MARSKYNILQLIFTIFGSLAVCGMGLAALQKTPVGIFAVVAGLALFYFYFLKTPCVLLNDEGITVHFPFRKLQHSWADLQTVSLHSNSTYSLFSGSSESLLLLFSDGGKLVMFNDRYRNLGSLRRYLNEKCNLKFDSKVRVPNAVTTKEYRGNLFACFNTIILMVFTAFMIFIIVMFKGKTAGLFFVCPVTLLMFVFTGLQMYYFVIEYEDLIVKNQYFPWIRRVYRLADIVEVATEIPYRRSKGLRIITTDQESKFYGAGSLWTKQWNQLLQDLQSVGITVR